MPNQIVATPPASKTTPRPALELTGPLKCWLLDESSDEIAVRTIRASEILRRQARDAMPALRLEATRCATVDEIKGVIGQRFALFPQPQRTDGEWAAWWADYIEALQGLTPYAVEAGMAAWVRQPEAEFMCKPGKLRELASTTSNANRWAKALSRARLATHEEIPASPALDDRSDRPTKEEVQTIMEAFHTKMIDKDPFGKLRPKAVRPTPSAPVDETGVSEEMRSLLQRQRVA